LRFWRCSHQVAPFFRGMDTPRGLPSGPLGFSQTLGMQRATTAPGGRRIGSQSTRVGSRGSGRRTRQSDRLPAVAGGRRMPPKSPRPPPTVAWAPRPRSQKNWTSKIMYGPGMLRLLEIVPTSFFKMPLPDGLRQAVLWRTFGRPDVAWSVIDTNGSGAVSMVELEDGLRVLRIPWMQWGAMHFREIFSTFDPNRDGLLDTVELLQWQGDIREQGPPPEPDPEVGGCFGRPLTSLAAPAVRLLTTQETPRLQPVTSPGHLMFSSRAPSALSRWAGSSAAQSPSPEPMVWQRTWEKRAVYLENLDEDQVFDAGEVASLFSEALMEWPGDEAMESFCETVFKRAGEYHNHGSAGVGGDSIVTQLLQRGIGAVLLRHLESKVRELTFEESLSIPAGEAHVVRLAHHRPPSMALRVIRGLLRVACLTAPEIFAAALEEDFGPRRNAGVALAVFDVVVGVYVDANDSVPYQGILTFVTEQAVAALMRELFRLGIMNWLDGVQEYMQYMPPRYRRGVGQLRGLLIKHNEEAATKAMEQNIKEALSMDEQRLRAIEQEFNRLDSDGSGKLSSDELAVLLRDFGVKPSKAELDRLLGEVDVDGDDELGWDEFLVLMEKLGKDRNIEAQFTEARLQEYREMFAMFDVDGDGTVTPSELGIILRKLGLNLSPNELARMVASVDADNSGAVEWKEFLALMRQQSSGDVDGEDQATQAFRILEAKSPDGFGYGYIETESFVKKAKELAGLRDEDVEVMLSNAKFENDDMDRITYQEFVKMVMAG